MSAPRRRRAPSCAAPRRRTATGMPRPVIEAFRPWSRPRSWLGRAPEAPTSSSPRRPTRRESSRDWRRPRRRARRASSCARVFGRCSGRLTDPDGDRSPTSWSSARSAPRRGPVAGRPPRRFYSFDTTSLPDGEYVFRLAASDSETNPGRGQDGIARDSSPVRIDNTPPVIRELRSTGIREPDSLPGDRLGLTADRGRVQRGREEVDPLEPHDGLSDSPTRSPTRSAFRPDERGGYLLVRATDASRNVAAASFSAP